MDKEQIIINAVNSLKEGEFKATAIKVELEAQCERYNDCDDVYFDIMSALEDIGLSDGHEVKHPLVYAKVYDDGSVDTELTFTLMLDDPKNVFLLPKIVRIFTEVASNHGDYFETDNAGMHMSLINDPKGYYNGEGHARLSQPQPYDATRFKNFSKSMIRLLPALYFLGSCDAGSRSLEFRAPRIARTENSTGHRFIPEHMKFSAIAFRHGAVEFRLFETCYGKPDAILDNVVVMSNAMKFWTRAYTMNNLRRIKQPVNFGVGGNGLERLYITSQHIDLLHDGLNILKPAYYTVNQLKKQRNFTVTKKSINAKRREIKQTALKNFAEYERRYKWQVVYAEQDHIRTVLERYAFGGLGLNTAKSEEQVLAEVKKEAKVHAARYAKERKPNKTKFVKDDICKRLPTNGGNWKLEVEPEQVEQSIDDPDQPIDYARYIDTAMGVE